MNSKDFLGSGLKFPLQVDAKTGKLALSVHEEDIKEAIKIIINTYRGERVMRPTFGSTVPEYAFAPSQYSTEQSIAYEVHEQLLIQEPRIVDVSVNCREQSGVMGSMIVEIAYTVRSTNNRYNQVYPFYLGEGEEA